jgi:hypothetical protein
VPEAYWIDEATGTDFWTKAIAKEMKNVMPAFKFTDNDRIPKGHSYLTVHGIFDVKMDLTRKFRLVADGYKTPESTESVYSSVVLQDSVCLFFYWRLSTTLMYSLQTFRMLACLLQQRRLCGLVQDPNLDLTTRNNPARLSGPCTVFRDLGKPFMTTWLNA